MGGLQCRQIKDFIFPIQFSVGSSGFSKLQQQRQGQHGINPMIRKHVTLMVKGKAPIM